MSDDKDALLLRLLGSDFLFWTALHVARDPLIRHVLATPPEQVAPASDEERARVNDLAERILPVSARAAGLRDDTRLGERLGPYALETIRAPTLVVSALDDGFGTYAAAQFTDSRTRARSSSVSTRVAFCWWGTTLRFGPSSSAAVGLKVGRVARCRHSWLSTTSAQKRHGVFTLYE